MWRHRLHVAKSYLLFDHWVIGGSLSHRTVSLPRQSSFLRNCAKAKDLEYPKLTCSGSLKGRDLVLVLSISCQTPLLPSMEDNRRWVGMVGIMLVVDSSGEKLDKAQLDEALYSRLPSERSKSFYDLGSCAIDLPFVICFLWSGDWKGFSIG